MKNASNVRLSLRKLLIATLAVGPLAVLPAPVWAVLPVGQQFTVTSGTATWSTSGATSATIQASDKSILVWNANQFDIAAGDTWNFILPAGGAVLNKVGYTTAGALGGAETVDILGTLFSTGKVFVLANGNINVGNAASVTTNGGLYLSTLAESSDFGFATVGTLSGTGASTGTITIGTAGGAPTISGNLNADAGTIVSHGATVSGDVVLRSITAAQPIDLAQSAAFAAGGNLTVTTNAGSISGTNAVTAGLQVTGNQTAALSTGTGGAGINVTLANAANDFEIITVNAPGSTANVSLRDANIITLGASVIGQDLIVRATGTADTTSLNTNGTVIIGRDASFETVTANAAINIGNNSTLGRNLAAKASNSGITFQAASAVTIGSVNDILGAPINGITTLGFAGAGGNRAVVNVRATDLALTVNAPITTSGNNTSGGGITLTGGSVTTAAGGTISQSTAVGSTVTANATIGAVTIGGAISADRVTLRTAGGSISQTGTGTITTTSAGTNAEPVANVFNAGTGTISLNLANAMAANSVVQTTGSAASITNTNGLHVGTTNLTGGLTVNITGAGNGLQIGAGLGTAGQAINVGGLLTVTTAGGAITDQDYGTVKIFGGLNLTTANGAVTLDAARAFGALSPRVEYGAVSINSGTGAIDITETSTLNIGNIVTTAAAGAVFRSTAGGIVDSGVINTGGTSALFVLPSTDSLVLDSTGHNLGTLVINGGNAGNAVTVGSATTLGGVGATATVTPALALTSSPGVAITIGNGVTSSVTELTVNSGGTISVAGAVSSTTLSLTSQDASATSISDVPAGSLTVSGVTTLASAGGIALNDPNHDFSSVVFNGVAGDARVDDRNAISVSGSGRGLIDVRSGANAAVPIGGAWGVSVGNLTAGSLNLRAQDGTGGTGGGISGTITQQTGTTLRSEGAVTFTTDGGNIVIGNSGNSFGRVNASAGNAAITIQEYGTIRLGAVSNNGSAARITSQTGSIIEDNTIGAAATSYTTTNATLTLTANATDGSILLGRQTNVVGGPVTAGGSHTIVASAPNGSVQLYSNTTNLTLGNITGNSFSVIHNSNGNLTQSGSIKSFGAASFTSNGNIIMTNTTNNFGRVSITGNTTASNTKNITLTEAGTLNIGAVTMAATAAGNLTLTSVNGDIIDTGLGGAKFGGTVAAPGTGVVSFSAANGNIVLDDPTTDFATNTGVVFNGKNVTLSGLGQSTIWLGVVDQPSTAGNLTVTSAIGNIGNTGNLTVSGSAFFQAGAGNITINQPSNQFGSLRFVGNQVAVAQTNSMKIQTGSSAIGIAQLASTGGNVTVENVGGGAVSFGNTVSISASGSITLPKLIQAVGTLSVTAAGTKDLSALSISGDLSGKAPVNVGTGTYLPPLP